MMTQYLFHVILRFGPANNYKSAVQFLAWLVNNQIHWLYCLKI